MLRFTDSLHWGSKGASGIWLDSPLEVKDTSSQNICGNSASQGLPDPKPTDVKSSGGKKILQRGLEKPKSFCLSSMPACVVLTTAWIRYWKFETLLSPVGSRKSSCFTERFKDGGGIWKQSTTSERVLVNSVPRWSYLSRCLILISVKAGSH